MTSVNKIILSLLFFSVCFCSDEKNRKGIIFRIQDVLLQSAQKDTVAADYRKTLRDKIDLSLTELGNYTSDLTCSEDSHCGLLRLSYYSACDRKDMFYSSATVSVSKLEEMLRSHHQLTEEYRHLYLMSSACTALYIPPPVPLCVSNICKDSYQFYSYLQNAAYNPSSVQCTNSGSCKVLALSAKDCGIYLKTYIVYSTESVNETDLLAGASYYERIIAKGARPEYTFSCSSQTSPPAVSCISGVCK